MVKKPLVSVFTTCKNAENYIRGTLDSILSQSYENLEILISDGLSTDGTVAIIQEYARKDSRIRYKTEQDNDAIEGFYKSMSMASGKYIMCLPISDIYLSKSWINLCVDALELDPELSLVFGCLAHIDAQDTLTGLPFPEWLTKPPPSKMDLTSFYLATFCFIPEISYCVRKDVYMRCFPEKTHEVISYEIPEKGSNSKVSRDPFLVFIFQFFKYGYLARYLPVISSAGRAHNDSRTLKLKQYLENDARLYVNDVIQLRRDILRGKIDFSFKNSENQVLKILNRKDRFLMFLRVLKFRLTRDAMFGHRENRMIRFLRYLSQILRSVI
jgi:glycosyltransferase involved in cell wall biosynthesis